MLLNARRRLHGAWDEFDSGPYDPFATDDWIGLNDDELIRKHLRLVETAHDAAENYVEGVRLIPGYGDAIDLVDLAKDPTDAQKWSRLCPGPGDVLSRFRNLRRASKFADDLGRARRIPAGYTDRIGKIASELGRTEKEIRDAIHKAKRNLPKGGPVKNPDVVIDPKTGEVYPKAPDGSIGDSIGNIFDYLD